MDIQYLNKTIKIFRNKEHGLLLEKSSVYAGMGSFHILEFDRLVKRINMKEGFHRVLVPDGKIVNPEALSNRKRVFITLKGVEHLANIAGTPAAKQFLVFIQTFNQEDVEPTFELLQKTAISGSASTLSRDLTMEILKVEPTELRISLFTLMLNEINHQGNH